jgi:hypothetical protein
MKNDVKSTDGLVAEQITDFLNSQSLQRHGNVTCESCGSKMQHREFHFWLAGTGMTWNIRLPVCVRCAQPKAHKGLGHSEAA